MSNTRRPLLPMREKRKNLLRIIKYQAQMAPLRSNMLT